MPPAPWTTPAQRVFLWTHIVAFREAQEAKTTDDYLANVYELWFLKYPQPDESQISKDKKRVYDWLRNRATPSRYKGIGELAHQARCTIVQLLLNTVPPKKKRKPQPAHAFSALYFDKGLGDKIEAAYLAMRNDPTITPKLGQVDFYGKETRRLYQEASEEVKKEVEEYRNKAVAEDLGDELERFLYEEEVVLDNSEKGRLAEGRQTQMAIDVLEPLLYEIVKTIEEVTGWRTHIMVGGPEPFRDGKITSISVGSGKSIDKDETFKAYHTGYQKEVEDQFSAYLKKSFRPEQRAVFANIPFRDWVPALRSSSGQAQPLRNKKGTGRKRKAKVSKEGTHEDDIRPRKKTGQEVSSDDISVVTSPQIASAISADDTQPIIPEDSRPIPPIPTSTPVPEPSTDLTSAQSDNSAGVQRSVEVEVEVEVDMSLPASLQVVAKRINRDGAESYKMASTGSWVTEYEMKRLKQIEKNRQLLVETMPVSASQILPVKPGKNVPATTRQRRDRVKVAMPEKRTLPRRQASTRSAGATHTLRTVTASHGGAQADNHGGAQATSAYPSSSASRSHGQTSPSVSNPFDPIDRLIPDASQSLDDISLDDEDDEDNEDSPLGPNFSGSVSLPADDSTLNSSSTFKAVRPLDTTAAATVPSDGLTSYETSPRLDRRLSDSSTDLPSANTANCETNTRLDRRLDSSSSSPSSNVITNGEPNARLDRRLVMQDFEPSADRDISSAANISFDFPAFERSALPPWLSGPVSHLSENFCGTKELLLIRGLVALEQKWGSIDHKMDTEGRPDAVSWWLSRGRPLDKHKMPLDLPLYGMNMRKWWMAHQPSFRLEGGSSWPLSQVAPVDGSWDGTRRGGKNGLLVFVMSLYWWKVEAQSQDSEKALSEFYLVVDDALYVFKSMLVSDQQISLCDAGFPTGRSSKRQRLAECKTTKSSQSSAGQDILANKENVRATRSRAAKH